MEIPLKHPQTVEFGSCRWCNESFRNKLTEVELTTASGALLLSQVPQGYSPTCNGAVFKLGTLRRIDACFKSLQYQSSQ